MLPALFTPLAALLVLATGAGPETSPAELSETAVAEGRLRLSASVTEGRLRVALVDLEDRVGRVQAFVLVGDRKVLLPRLDTTAADRLEFKLDPRLGTRPTIRIEAHLRNAEPPILLHAIELETELALPLAPSPRVLEPVAAPKETPTVLPWWIIAGAVVAATLGGVAVYQEFD